MSRGGDRREKIDLMNPAEWISSTKWDSAKDKFCLWPIRSCMSSELNTFFV